MNKSDVYYHLTHIMVRIIKTIAAKAGYRISRIGTEADFAHFARDTGFEEAYAGTKAYSMLGPDRSFTLWQFARQGARLEGDAAEVGVYKGGSAKLIAEALRGSGKSLHLFDTFGGMPEVDPRIDLHKKDDFSDVSLEQVQRLFTPEDHTHFYPGVFPDTSGPIKGKRFSFVYLDADIYASTRDALEFFYPRVVPGGFIVLDDYQGKHTPGVKKALDEFLVGKRELPIITTVAQCVLIKQPH